MADDANRNDDKSKPEILYEKYVNRYNREVERSRIISQINTIQKEISIYEGCNSEIISTKEFYPLLAGSGSSRISIMNLGTFPPYKVTPAAIIPINFSVKKKYYKYRGCKQNSKDKIFYFIKIEEAGPRIEAEDKYVFKNWEEFVSLTEIPGEKILLEEFIGVTIPNVTNYIEKLGDVSEFKQYIPYSNRNKF